MQVLPGIRRVICRGHRELLPVTGWFRILTTHRFSSPQPATAFTRPPTPEVPGYRCAQADIMTSRSSQAVRQLFTVPNPEVSHILPRAETLVNGTVRHSPPAKDFAAGGWKLPWHPPIPPRSICLPDRYLPQDSFVACSCRQTVGKASPGCAILPTSWVLQQPATTTVIRAATISQLPPVQTIPTVLPPVVLPSGVQQMAELPSVLPQVTARTISTSTFTPTFTTWPIIRWTMTFMPPPMAGFIAARIMERPGSICPRRRAQPSSTIWPDMTPM